MTGVFDKCTHNLNLLLLLLLLLLLFYIDISRRPELSTVAAQILPTRAIFAAALQTRQLFDARIWLCAACRRVFPQSTKLRVMSTYFVTVTSLSTPCLSRK